MKFAQIQRLIKTVLFTPGLDGRWGLPFTLWGSPGTAKSAIVVQEAAKMGLHPITVAPNGRPAMDIMGLPHIVDGAMEYAIPTWVRDADAVGHSLIFLDERNTADPTLQPAMLRMLRDGVVGDHTLKHTVRFISACNPVDEGANASDEAPALANRSGHIDWQMPSLDEWIDYTVGSVTALPGSSDAAAHKKANPAMAKKIEKEVCQKWPDTVSRWAANVGSFLKRRPEFHHKMPDVMDPEAAKAWCSPRTWDLAIRGLAGGEIHGMDHAERMQLVEHFVGQAAAFEFSQWYIRQDLPDPADVLSGRVSFIHEPSRLDRTFAVIDSCVTLCRTCTDKKLQKKYVNALWDIMGSLAMTYKDAISRGVTQMIRAGRNQELPIPHNSQGYKLCVDVFKDVVQRIAAK